MNASKNGKIAGIVVYKTKVPTSNVTIEIRTYIIHVMRNSRKFIITPRTFILQMHRNISGLVYNINIWQYVSSIVVNRMRSQALS